MTRLLTMRDELRNIVRSVPFHPFAIVLENGDRIIVEHPENVAFDPSDNGRDRLHIISNQLVHYGTISSITSLVVLDRGQVAA